jgi:hypothetical protein
MAYTTNYFKNLALSSIQFIDSLPMQLTPQPLEYTLTTLNAAVDRVRADQIQRFKDLKQAIVSEKKSSCTPGLNTIGMLTDRFTILIIREWCIRNKINNKEKADTLFNTQTMEIIKAMEEANEGYSSLNSKITNIKANARAECWEEAYFGLLSTNLLLWESQEVLYIKDIQSLPTEEIRDYIKWFSFGNVLRNEYIETCESMYWMKFRNTK